MEEGICLVSKDFKILWANRALEEQTGYSSDEMIGRHCYEVTHHCKIPCKAPHDPCPITDVLKTGISWRNLRSNINWNTLPIIC